MKVCVMGLWHLGAVTAACLAGAGHDVIGLDFDGKTIADLHDGRPPLYEPGLEELVRQGIAKGNLRFTQDVSAALAGAEVLWVTYDTPVDEDDHADVEFVIARIQQVFSHLRDGLVVIISSQLPVGSTRRLERAFAEMCPGRSVSFAYSPENLRLGNAIDVFSHPDRIVVGTRPDRGKETIGRLLRPVTQNIEWMTVESAEMTKHAVNAFLALSVTFANEIAVLCEQVGADAKEVERGLKSEARIGQRAYVAPGTAFAGGTLARDVAFLTRLGDAGGIASYVLRAVRTSNDEHRTWIQRALTKMLGSVSGKTIALWGLTYKPGTDTLRRSASVELAVWLAREGARVVASDPAVQTLPLELSRDIACADTPLNAVRGAVAVIVATAWPAFREISSRDLLAAMAGNIVIDPNRFLAQTLGADARIRYAAVGSLPRRSFEA